MGPRAPRGHEQIEHTADVGVHVWAPSLEELFAEGALALIDVMGRSRSAPSREEQVHLEAPDLNALFVDWLSEVLFLFEARSFVTHGADIDMQETSLRARLEGSDAATLEQHGPAVKAVTFHGLEITRSDHGYEAHVYLDV